MATVTASNGAVLVTDNPDKKITRLAFKQRMTAAERIAIRDAASVNTTIYDFMDLLSEAEYIDLQYPDTIAGVNSLESAGLIAPGRAAEILNAPIIDNERP